MKVFRFENEDYNAVFVVADDIERATALFKEKAPMPLTEVKNIEAVSERNMVLLDD